MLTFERAQQLFKYDSATGELYWKCKPSNKSNRIKAGDAVGNIAKGSRGGYYKQCSVDKEKYLVHRIVWLIHHGEFPKHEIDHVDGNGLNNRIENLRAVTGPENRKNLPRRRDNTSGVTGVSWHNKAKKWLAQAQVEGKYVYLGLFDTVESAAQARARASENLGFHANHGRAQDG
ncbi:HNH endonuclease signature motif containing protein [Burkholderia multivorans]|uniref:HNH endonuclease signature motif containing protein n=1 Tax=Burkholderia multivorans TaxID=87883 RepID=UPI002019D614|nr:HNH endonuclease signature motif containing protein [Burkholderia multivorans]MCO1367170.1 HNH endonuclease [Burkholderia multivorans]MCO1376779.1 HNH endonuclease [Burkholderia multivorans]MDN7951761.1 HNH endonuclease signature motif containing protein [Burkholderia multivorans]MDN8047564.1 HNH endonuclease signature motif containing protein [Burkholderia multivorans]UQP18725.1 HNH endonuclease [Burkholderia multivorans]